MNMRTFILFCLLALSLPAAQAQSNQWSAGFQLNELGQDFGIGLNFASPYFANDYLAIRLRANYQYFEYVDQEKTTWDGYLHFNLGLVSASYSISEKLRLYSEGGVVLVTSAFGLDENELHFGGYGLFGFEFHYSPGSTCFIELGGQGVSAIAEELPNQPFYSNGFTMSVGTRYYF